jgi:hypothetical protein
MHHSRSAHRPFRRTCTERHPAGQGPDVTARRHLHRWVLNLPWVTERPAAICAPGLRWFAVDCTSLRVSRIWLLTGPIDNEGGRLDLHIVVPAASLERIFAMADAELAAPIGQTHHLVTVPDGIARWPNDQLETLVRTAYDASLR